MKQVLPMSDNRKILVISDFQNPSVGMFAVTETLKTFYGLTNLSMFDTVERAQEHFENPKNENLTTENFRAVFCELHDFKESERWDFTLVAHLEKVLIAYQNPITSEIPNVNVGQDSILSVNINDSMETLAGKIYDIIGATSCNHYPIENLALPTTA